MHGNDSSRKTEEFQSRDRLNRMRSEARRQRLKERLSQSWRGGAAARPVARREWTATGPARAVPAQARPGRGSPAVPRRGRATGKLRAVQAQARPRRAGIQPARRNRDSDMAEEQGLEQFGGRPNRGEFRRERRGEFRHGQGMGGEPQGDRRGRKRGHKSDQDCERSEGVAATEKRSKKRVKTLLKCTKMHRKNARS